MRSTAIRRASLVMLAVACTASPIAASRGVAGPPEPPPPADLLPSQHPEPRTVPRTSPRLPPQQTSGRARFAVTLASFRAIDESGADWSGSDEVIGHFVTNNGANYYTDAYGDVDSGDLVYFRASDRCLAPRLNCSPSNGLPGPFRLELELWEDDVCNAFPACFDPSTGGFPLDPNDDLIGRKTVTYSAADLLARLDRVGNAINVPFRLGGPCGHQEPGDPVCGFGPLTATGPEYELRIVVKRVPDAPAPRNSP